MPPLFWADSLLKAPFGKVGLNGFVGHCTGDAGGPAQVYGMAVAVGLTLVPAAARFLRVRESWAGATDAVRVSGEVPFSCEVAIPQCPLFRILPNGWVGAVSL